MQQHQQQNHQQNFSNGPPLSFSQRQQLAQQQQQQFMQQHDSGYGSNSFSSNNFNSNPAFPPSSSNNSIAGESQRYDPVADYERAAGARFIFSLNVIMYQNSSNFFRVGNSLAGAATNQENQQRAGYAVAGMANDPNAQVNLNMKNCF